MERETVPFTVYNTTEVPERRLFEAVAENDRLRADNERMLSVIAQISYCDAQCGADAMKMRNMAMDFMRSRAQG